MMAERRKLTITDIPEQRTIGDKNIPLQEFYAGGKKYSVFSKTLFPYIKLNSEIDAEVEVTTTESQGNTYTNLKVTDIFVNGQSVKGQGGGYRGKSPEELELSRRSYALSYAKDLAVAGKIEVNDIPGKATEFSDWLKSTATAVKKAVKEVLEPMGAVAEGEESLPQQEEVVKPPPIDITKILYATKQQIDTLKSFELKHPGKSQELMNKHGFKKKLTKANADILIDEFVLLEDAK